MSQDSTEEPGQAAHEGLADEGDVPKARAGRHWGGGWIWLVPVAALGLVGYLFYSWVTGRGPEITITFETAEGLSAEQTQVKYKSLALGTVEDITLSDDSSRVVARVRMDDRAEPLLTENTRFWVVRPRLSGGLSAISAGLSTLVSGPYVAMDPGAGSGQPRRHFQGVEAPPSIRSDEPGTVYLLTARELGGLSAGTPIYYRDVVVGEVLSYELLTEPQEVRLRVFVRDPYDHHVVAATRFWKESGVSLQTGTEGLSLELQSMRTLLMGGIAFQTPKAAREHEPSQPESSFRLHDNRSAAEVTFYADSVPYVSYFQSSVRGLTRGSEVHMFGRKLGAVTDVALVRDPRSGHEGELSVRVDYVLQPERALPRAEWAALGHPGMRSLVANDLRVVLKTQNLLTGQKALSLEYLAKTPPVALVREGEALVLPSETHGLQAMYESLAAIVNQIRQIPIAEIGKNLDRTLASVEHTVDGPELKRSIASLDATMEEAHALVQEARSGVRPALARLLRIGKKLETTVDQADAALGQNGYGEASTVQRNLERMMEQTAEAARSIRLLADYLQRHPEAVVRGRSPEKP